MNITKTAVITAATLATTLALAGCSAPAGSGGHMSGTDMPSSTTPAMTASPAHNEADVMFAQMMIVHHMQAVEMSEMVLGKPGVAAKVTDLATKIKAAQSPEIDQMNGFLSAWGQRQVTSSDMDDMAMGNTMSQEDMDKLDKASGPDASKLFLAQMIQHHSSAVTMARDEVQHGKNADAVALAEKIVSDQTAEIDSMKAMMQKL